MPRLDWGSNWGSEEDLYRVWRDDRYAAPRLQDRWEYSTFTVPPATWTTSSSNTTYSYPWPRITASSNATWHVLTYNGFPLRIDDSLEERVISLVEPAPDASLLTSAQTRAAAQSRAEELLLELLPADQHERFRLDGTFEIIGSCGTLYRVHRGTSGNIEWIKPDGTVGGRLCAHPTMRDGWLPTADVMLSQLLALTTDEREFLRLANVHRGTAPPLVAA